MSESPKLSDHEFAQALGGAVDRYLRAVDEWESAYQKYYRLPGYSKDLNPQQREYDARRKELGEMLPRAKRLCYRHKLSEPFSGLLRISLGMYAPQERSDSAIGRSERNRVAVCLVELRALTREWESAGDVREQPVAKESLLRRVVNFFT